MASQKQTRAASGRNSSSGTRTRAGSSASARGTSGTAARSSQSGRTQGKSQGNGRGQAGQARNGQGGNGQARNGQGGQAAGSRAGQGRMTATQAKPGTGTVSLATSRAPAGRGRPPLWFQLTTLVLSAGGLGVSIYLTVAHYTSASNLFCSDKGVINCAKVTTSPESVVFGIFPVAVLGLAFYVFMVAINTPWAWRSRFGWMAWLRTAGAITGIGFVLYLVYAEIIEIGNICLWCTSVHVITFLLFVLLMSVAPFTKRAQPALGAPA
jgi:uncharacterized membrane protein